MVEIIPAILPKSFSDLQEKMALVAGLTKHVQVDVCDGVFVQNKTWPYTKKSDPDFAKILKEEGGFPYWEEVDFEVDLMVVPTEDTVRDWITAGAKRIIIHLESGEDQADLFKKIRTSLPDKESLLHTELGVAIDIDTPNKKLSPFLPYVDFVQFMGIAKIGVQGEPFDDRVLDKISRLRLENPNVTISVDGGVNTESAPKLLDAGVNRLVIGSAIFESGDIPGTIDLFENLAQASQLE